MVKKSSGMQQMMMLHITRLLSEGSNVARFSARAECPGSVKDRKAVSISDPDSREEDEKEARVMLLGQKKTARLQEVTTMSTPGKKKPLKAEKAKVARRARNQGTGTMSSPGGKAKEKVAKVTAKATRPEEDPRVNPRVRKIMKHLRNIAPPFSITVSITITILF